MLALAPGVQSGDGPSGFTLLLLLLYSHNLNMGPTGVELLNPAVWTGGGCYALLTLEY